MTGRARVRPVFLTVCLGRVRALPNPALFRQFWELEEEVWVMPGFRPLLTSETLRVGDWVYHIGAGRRASVRGRFLGVDEFLYLESVQEDPNDWYPYALRRKEEA